MRHNFHVERHLKFEVENGVKSWSMLADTSLVQRKLQSWLAVHAKSVAQNPYEPL
jgi:hypothetical protein